MTGEKKAGPNRASGYCKEHKRATCQDCAVERNRIDFDMASGKDWTVEMNYQLKDEGVEVASITDKTDSKNVRGDWFNPFGGEDNGQSLRNFQASLDARSRQAFELAQEVNELRGTVRDRDCEIRVLRQACKAAGDEIRELHAQRKPEQHGAYWLTFPECSTSRGMYWATAWLLAVGGLLLAWWPV
jgi:hypothetical protein